VLNDQPDVEFAVLAHTESVVHPQEVLVDNWDLSVKRATSVIRVFADRFFYLPVADDCFRSCRVCRDVVFGYPGGRVANRRTRVVIQPQLDPLLRLLERKGDADMADGK